MQFKISHGFIVALLAGAAMPMHAQMAGSSCVARQQGLAMMADQNFVGALDQLNRYANVHQHDYPYAPLEQVAQLNRAIANLNMGQAVLAERQFADFLAEHAASPLRAQAMMGLGDCAYATKDYAHAAELYGAIDPQCIAPAQRADYYYRQGYSLLKTAEYARALGCFQALGATKGADAQYLSAANFYQGYIYFTQGDYTQARQAFGLVDPHTAPGNMAPYYMSQIYYSDGDYTRAISQAKEALQTGVPAAFQPEMNRIIGESLYQQGRPDQALAYLKKYANAVQEPQPSTLYIMGLSYYDNGQYEEAIKAFTPATGGDDAMAQSAYLYLGQAALKTDNTDTALMAFNRALRLDIDPEVTEAALYNYAVAQARGGKMPFASSVTTFEDFLTRYPNSRYAQQVQEYIVEGYLTDQNYQAALTSINRMQHPTAKVLGAKQRVLYNLGHQALASDDNATALKYLTQADQLSAYDKGLAAENALLMGEANYRQGNYADAAKNILAYINAAGAKGTNRPLAYYMLGYVRFQQEKYGDAATDFERALQGAAQLPAGTDADCWNRIGDCRYYQKDFAAAAQAYQNAYDKAPNTGDYSLFQLAMMQGYQGHNDAKVQLLDKLMAQYTQSALIPDAMLEKAQTLYSMGRQQQAQEAYAQLIDAYPATSQGRNASLQLAMAQAQAGQATQAIATYKKVISSYPSSPEAAIAANMLRQVCEDNGRMADYLAFIDETPAIDPDGVQRTQALKQLVLEANRAGRANEVLEYAGQMVQNYPDSPETIDILAIKAQTEMEQGMGMKAMETYRRLLASAKGVEQANTARTGLMRIARDLGMSTEVIAQADALTAAGTIAPALKNEAIFSRGLAQQQLGQTAKAQAEWRTIASETKDLYGAKAAVYLAQSLYDQKQYAQAQDSVTEFINSQPADAYWLARGFVVLSDAMRAQGNEFEANEYLKSLRDNYPGTETDIFEMIDQRLK